MDPTKKRKQPDSAFNEDPSSGDGAVSEREGDIQDLRLKDRNAIGQGSQKFHSAETPVIKATAEMVEGLGFLKQATSEEQPLAGPSSEGSTILPPDQQQPQPQQQQSDVRTDGSVLSSGPSEHYKEFIEEALEVLNNT
ncbi:hypothetical protein FCM35_KLT10059 [Carex littledalei]|uniref:Uncharacterized protein n=1 Tax=Carex littledalei TaxID=544730 RepID=A0A833R9N0_9POAL|nr:hypothetical protein FCM35_KLT10059 [Carex littledalei]